MTHFCFGSNPLEHVIGNGKVNYSVYRHFEFDTPIFLIFANSISTRVQKTTLRNNLNPHTT